LRAVQGGYKESPAELKSRTTAMKDSTVIAKRYGMSRTGLQTNVETVPNGKGGGTSIEKITVTETFKKGQETLEITQLFDGDGNRVGKRGILSDGRGNNFDIPERDFPR
ncbi:MAG: hypothetical protein K1X64_23495, partial [Myxococcaceae bacterium]|nr:hypothetical protein [Myxococcaceae bacterium]